MGEAFELGVDGDGIAELRFDLPDRRANIFTRDVMAELEQAIPRLTERDDIRALVLLSGKPDIFIAGADVEEIAGVVDPAEAEAGSRYGQRLFDAWSRLPFPTLAAIRGTCLGGGTELALASTWMAASDRPDLRIGLPEVQLGIVPGWGGCVRMPRRIGLRAALDLILTGKAVDGRRALRLGLVDTLLPDADFDRRAVEFARRQLDAAERRRSKGGPGSWLLERNPLGRSIVVTLVRRRTLAKTKGRYPAALRALDVIAAGLARGMAAGFDAEARAIGELATSVTAKNLIHVFRLIEDNKRDGGEEVAAVARPGVIGAGVMGGGIAALIVEKTDLPVRVKDLRADALATALAHASGLLSRKARHKRLPAAVTRRRMALLQPTLEDAGLGACDFVIEAIVEDLATKQRLFADLGKRTAESAVLASNTSSLSIDDIGRLAIHRDRVVGMHFFNPVDRMPLVEVVVGRQTSDGTARRVAAFARRLGKTPVVVRECPGFLVNRLLAFYSAEALWLLDEGYSVEQIDGAMLDWGMPMGPLRLADEVGLDVSAKVGAILHGAFGDRLILPAWAQQLPQPQTLGVKSGSGFYRYEGRKERGIAPDLYRRLGLPAERRGDADRRLLAERMVLPMVNEAARCLEEGIVARPGTLDLALVFGIGFPPFRGGLCRWADEQGIEALLSVLERLESDVGGRYRPAEPLRAVAARGGFYTAS